MIESFDKLYGKTILVVGAASREGAEFCKSIFLRELNVKIIGVDCIPFGDEGAEMYERLDEINHIVNKKYVEMPVIKKTKIWFFFDELLSNPGVLDNIFSAYMLQMVFNFNKDDSERLKAKCDRIGVEFVEM